MTSVPAFMPLLRKNSGAAALILSQLIPVVPRPDMYKYDAHTAYAQNCESEFYKSSRTPVSCDGMTFPRLFIVSLVAIAKCVVPCTMYVLRAMQKALTGITAGSKQSKQTTNQLHQMLKNNQLSAFRFPSLLPACV